MDRTPIDIRHLQTLVALRNSGSVSRAAAWMQLTQGALSHQIKALEDFYGLPLFVRKSTPITFTPAGLLVLEAADRILPVLQQTSSELLRLAQGSTGTLRIAIECHTCFDWLIPALDVFRSRWPNVDVDLVSGYQSDPIGLLHQQRADLAIVSVPDPDVEISFLPLFRFPIVAIVANDHPLAKKHFLDAEDFRHETLISYPVEEEALDIFRLLLHPAGIAPQRRTSELTVAILMLVATHRGIAVLPRWAIHGYLQRQYVAAKTITHNGLQGEVWAALRQADCHKPYLTEFIALVRETTAARFTDIALFN